MASCCLIMLVHAHLAQTTNREWSHALMNYLGANISSNYFSTWKLMTYMKSHKEPEVGSGVIEQAL